VAFVAVSFNYGAKWVFSYLKYTATSYHYH